MVAWASPPVLERAAVRAVLAPLFGRFADRRDVMAAAPPPPPQPHTGTDPVWVDFVADTGEGFDSTYTVARIVSADRLPVSLAEDPGAPGQGLPRGKTLLLGGDEVYPYAKPGAYRDRFEAPWGSALPRPPHQDHGSERLFAIPGNHDWYDGLSGFLRVFATFDHRYIGNRRTEQERSYFAVDLGHGWWTWGLDLQFDDFVDNEQLRYFTQVASSMRHGSRVLLVVPEPGWVHEALRSLADPPSAMIRAIEYLDGQVIQKHGHTLRAVLTGDLHHYARYEENMSQQGAGAPRQWITCGGGGAHLHGTHHLPPKINLKTRARFGTLTLQKVEPDPVTSRALSRGALGLPFRCPPVAVLLGLLAILAARILGPPAADAWALPDSLAGIVEDLKSAVIQHPVLTLLVLAFFAVFIGAADGRRLREKLALGLPHALVHAIAFAGILWGSTWAATNAVPASRIAILLLAAALFGIAAIRFLTGRPRTLRPWLLLLTGALLGIVFLFAKGPTADDVALRTFCLMLLPASLVHATLFGGYLAVASSRGRHVIPAFASQSLPDHKMFLRMRVAPGGLTIYPIGIKEVCRQWQWSQQAANGMGRYEPIQGQNALLAHSSLLERPLVFD